MENQELVSTRDLYICIYDDDKVGLFKKIKWNKRPRKMIIGYSFEAGNIYVGIDSDHIGMDKLHPETHTKDNWEPIGAYVKCNGKKYVSDCLIKGKVGFEEMRVAMYEECDINEFCLGQATSKELAEVLTYAYDFFEIDNKTKYKSLKH